MNNKPLERSFFVKKVILSYRGTKSLTEVFFVHLFQRFCRPLISEPTRFLLEKQILVLPVDSSLSAIYQSKLNFKERISTRCRVEEMCAMYKMTISLLRLHDREELLQDGLVLLRFSARHVRHHYLASAWNSNLHHQVP